MVKIDRNKDSGGEARKALTVAIIQPAYLPWLGYFDQMARADLFVHYDDVQFTRKSWQTRNQIKGPMGPFWLTVPVRHKGGYELISNMELAAGSWAVQHLKSIEGLYGKAPHLRPYFSDLQDVLLQPWSSLCELNVTLARLMAAWLGIYKQDCYASELGIPLDLDTTGRPLAICQAVGATRFICGPTAKAYINPAAFAAAGIELVWHEYVPPTYPQLWGPFQERMSALDAVLMLGPGAREFVGAPASAIMAAQ